MDTRPRVALLIDAENVAPGKAGEAVEAARALGNLRIARCYGNDEALRGWRDAIVKHHLTPRLTPPVSGKQNASDFALTIDAVTLLNRDLFEIAIIASSDADFAPLALHIRENGKSVCCIGDHRKLKPNFRTLFDQVIEFSAKARKAPAPPKPEPAPQPAKPVKQEIPVAELVAHFSEFNKGERKVSVPSFARFLGNRMPHGYRKGHGTVKNYLAKSGAFEIGKDNTITLKT